ncbi:hypothetical protein FRC00_002266 [Tulasnella sp. 408]|nr:hypothetical protein FRC00_002266 [Tulasnella sp. 408]
MDSIRKPLSAQPQDQDLVPSSGASSISPTLEAHPTTTDPSSKPEENSQQQTVAPGGLRFWLILVSLLVSTFLAALDLVSQRFLPKDSTASTHHTSRPSPYQVLHLKCSSNHCRGSRGNFVLRLGGKCVGVGQHRSLQGVGAGGIQSMTAIVISDLVPLSKRGAYQGLIAA